MCVYTPGDWFEYGFKKVSYTISFPRLKKAASARFSFCKCNPVLFLPTHSSPPFPGASCRLWVQWGSECCLLGRPWLSWRLISLTCLGSGRVSYTHSCLTHLFRKANVIVWPEVYSSACSAGFVFMWDCRENVVSLHYKCAHPERLLFASDVLWVCHCVTIWRVCHCATIWRVFHCATIWRVCHCLSDCLRLFFSSTWDYFLV